MRESRQPITSPAVTLTSRDVPYDTTPNAPAAPVANPTPKVQSSETGNTLNSVFSSFFGVLGNAAQVVNDAEDAAVRSDINKQSTVDQDLARAKAIRGEELTPEEAKNWNFVTPWKQTKAAVAADQDAQAWVNGPLKQLQLGDMPGAKDAMGQVMTQQLKGTQDKDYAAYYAEAFLKVAQPKIDEHKANLIQAQRLIDRDDARASAAIEIKQGLGNTPEWIDKQIAKVVTIAGPENAPAARSWAVSAMIEDAAKSGKLDGVIGALQQKTQPTPDNPTGLSWAERYPSAVDDMIQKARTQHSDDYNRASSAAIQQIDLSFKMHDVQVAPGVTGLQQGVLLMSQYAQKFDTTSKDYRQMEDHLAQLLNSAAKKDAAVSRLTTSSADGTYSPKDVNEVGGDILKNLVSNNQWPKAAALITQWGAAPKDWISGYANQLADTSRSNTAAAILDSGFMSLYRLAPEIVKREVGQDAEQVLDFVKAEQEVGNSNTLDAVTRAHSALERIRKAGINPADVVMYDQTAKTGKQDLEDQLRKALVGKVAPEYQSFLERNNPFDPSVVVDGEVSKAFNDAVKSRFIFNREGMGYDREKALKLAVASASSGLGSRVVALPTPNGDIVLKPDTAPDNAVKMRPMRGPEGAVTYDPAKDFQAQAKKAQLGFIGGSVGLDSDKANTPVDGSYKVVKDGNFPILFTPGQKLSWDEHQASTDPNMSGGGETVTRNVALADDPELAKAQLNELLTGTGFKVSAGTTAFRNGEVVPVWQLMWQPQPPAQQATSTQETLKGMAIDQGLTQPQPPGLVDRLSAKGGYADWQGSPAVKLPGDPGEGTGRFIQQQTESIVSFLRDKGMYPPSATKPVPSDFADAKDAWAWVTEQMQARKLKLGNLPLEANDTPMSERYVTARRTFLEESEGRRYEVYKDTKGIKTVGIGFNLEDPSVRAVIASEGVNVRAVSDGKEKMTDDEINRVFDRLVIGAEKVVSDRIKSPITSQQRLALVSLAYNNPSLIGPKLTEAINSGNKQAALYEVKENSDLKGSYRRQREADFLSMGSWSKA